MAKKIIDAKNDKNGNIKEVKLEGNTTFTSLESAIRMVEKGTIADANVSTSKNGKKYIRTNPNKSTQDNLDTLAEKNKK